VRVLLVRFDFGVDFFFSLDIYYSLLLYASLDGVYSLLEEVFLDLGVVLFDFLVSISCLDF